MFDYTDYECKSCKEKFRKDDDIVVCPECGTPYHRECYKKEGHCISYELHDSGKSWKDTAEKGTADKAVCKSCGNSLKQDQLFCDKCGAPTDHFFRSNNLKQDGARAASGGYENANETFRPFMVNFSDPLCGFNPDEEYEEGVTTRDLGNYVGSSTHYYLPKFKLMKTGRFKFSLNIPALFFPELYFANRKMPLAAFIVLILRIAITMPSNAIVLQTYLKDSQFYDAFTSSFPQLMEYVSRFMDVNLNTSGFNTLYNVSYIVSSVITIILSGFANYIYYRHALKKTSALKKVCPNGNAELLREQGGTSPLLMAAFIGLSIVLQIAAMLSLLFIIQ